MTGEFLGPLGPVLAILLILFTAGVVLTMVVLGFGLIFVLVGRVFACVAGIVGDVFVSAVNILMMPFNLGRALVLLVFARFAKADAAAARFQQNVVESVRRVWSAGIQRPFRILGIEIPPRRAKRTVVAAAAVSPNGASNVSSFSSLSSLETVYPKSAPPPPRQNAPAAPPPWPDPSTLISGFPGYTIDGRLPTGGSGAKLYIATPEPAKRTRLRGAPGRVVIKSFAIGEGSTLPQIVRESRSLDAARSLGLVLDHAFEPHRFWYAMPHFDGPSLGQHAATRHRAVAAEATLPEGTQRELVGLVAQVVESLARFHEAGLWHKDIKPDNIIVTAGRAELIDVGLVTPLASSFTLTTHGTEYFRDPEMVRQALRGTKVNEVDGARFDLYSAGAVLYAVLENTFPAHGALSSFSKPSPEALRWIVRRAMAEYTKRYPTAQAMLEDLRYVLEAKELAAVRPAQLPSMRRADPAAVDAFVLSAGIGKGSAPGVSAWVGNDVAPMSFSELARKAAQEAAAVARAATEEAVAAMKVATARCASRKQARRAAAAAVAASQQKTRERWSPWATAVIPAVVLMVLFTAKVQHSDRDGTRVSVLGMDFEKGPSRSERRAKSTASAPAKKSSTTDSIAADLPAGDGRLLVDRTPLAGATLPEALEARVMAGIGSKGWSPVTDDVDALAALEALRGGTPAAIEAELSRRGYRGLVRLESKGEKVLVTPVSLPTR